MKMRKIMMFLVSLLLIVPVVAGCSNASPADTSNNAAVTGSEPSAVNSSEPAATNSTASAEKAKVYVFIKHRGDLSYWDSIAESGDKAAADFADRADVKVIETTEDLTANLNAMYEAVDAGANLIITAGDYKDNFVEVAKEYPDIACAMISENVCDQAPNIYGFDFSVSQAAFLAGVAAADRAKQDGSDTIGFIGGMDETVIIQEFFVGYIQGAKYYNPDIKIVYNYVGGWADPDTARTQALAQYNDAGADVIFACAGGSGNGVHSAAAEVGKYVIGVDSDQSLMYDTDPKIQSCFVTSVLKLCNNAVYNTISDYLNAGTLPFGEYKILGVKETAVGIVENDLYNKYVSVEGKAKVKQAGDDISSGAVQVWSAIGKEQSEIQAKITELIG
jgi:basic membrane protein A